MIAALLFIGSTLGGLAAIAALISGQTVGFAAILYLTIAVASVLVISLGCAFRPRRTPSARDDATQLKPATSRESVS